MEDLLRAEIGESGDAGGGFSEGFTDAFAGGAAEDVVAIERGGEGDGGKKIFVKLGAELAEFVEGEFP
jgi:hypothetical protein